MSTSDRHPDLEQEDHRRRQLYLQVRREATRQPTPWPPPPSPDQVIARRRRILTGQLRPGDDT